MVKITLHHVRSNVGSSQNRYLLWARGSLDLSVYYFNYNLDRSDLVPIVMSLNFVSMISIFFILAIAKHIGKRNTMSLGPGLGIFGQMITGIDAYAGSITITTVITGTIIVQLGFGFIFELMSVMLADTVDYGKWISGVHAQGLPSASSFAVKFGMGIGGAVSALIMSYACYTPGTVQSSGALTAIEFNFVWLPAIGFAIAVLALCFHHVDKHETQIIYDLNKHHHAEAWHQRKFDHLYDVVTNALLLRRLIPSV